MTKREYRIVFPGDPEYDRSDPTRDWHYAIIFAAIVVVMFMIFAAALTRQPAAIYGCLAAVVTFVVAYLTAPFDPRYP